MLPTSPTRPHTPETPATTYIDWGPDLPKHYAGGRARLITASPTRQLLTWETETPPSVWIVEVRTDARLTHRLVLPGDATEAWLDTSGATHGEVALLREDGTTLACLAFTPPPAHVSADLSERWSQQSEAGPLASDDLTPPAGRRAAIADQPPTPSSSTAR